MRRSDIDVSRDPVLRELNSRVSGCWRCPRLAAYLDASRRKWPGYRGRPVPGWGDPRARLLVVGLAPGLHGANKTGRMFTWDSSGRWLYRVLHEVGLASRPVSTGPNDGLRLRGVYITSAVRCAPPANRPASNEQDNCRPYLGEELRRLSRVRVVVALGRIAHDAVLKVLGRRLARAPFAHGRLHELGSFLMIDSYHCSRQNTNTGKLTWDMWRGVFGRALELAK